MRDSYRLQTKVGLTHCRDGWRSASPKFKTGFEKWYGWGTDEFKVSQDTRLRYTQSESGALVPAEILAYNTPLTQENRYPMPFLMKADVFAEKAFATIQAGHSYRVIPWQMGLVAKLLRLLPNAVFDKALSGRARKHRQGER